MGQFRYILTNLGEKMSDEEVDELLKAVDTSSGELNYMGKWVHMVLWVVAVGVGCALTVMQIWSRQFWRIRQER